MSATDYNMIISALTDGKVLKLNLKECTLIIMIG